MVGLIQGRVLVGARWGRGRVGEFDRGPQEEGAAGWLLERQRWHRAGARTVGAGSPLPGPEPRLSRPQRVGAVSPGVRPGLRERFVRGA